MKAINQPNLSFSDVWQSCIDGIPHEDLKNRFNHINTHLVAQSLEYSQKAPIAELYLMDNFAGTNDDIVSGTITKQELKDLYSLYMVPANKPARTYYDQLKFAAPLNICPFCGFGHVSTLDHYLPKAKFPLISILPINLVPSCADCNKGKSASIATTKSKQCIHPYFDHGQLINEQWVFAEVDETSPASISYYSNPPSNWEEDDKSRVNSHFKDFKLANRYRTQASTELAPLKGELESDFNISGSSGVRTELLKRAEVAKSLHKNHWKTAMFQALANSEWYCTGGFRAV